MHLLAVQGKIVLRGHAARWRLVVVIVAVLVAVVGMPFAAAELPVLVPRPSHSVLATSFR